MANTDTQASPRSPRGEKLHWAHLYDEVITSGLCTGCAGCVVVCPHDVLGYDDTNGVYKPFHLEADGGPGGCVHGDKSCTSCTRACPRFRSWESEINETLFARDRDDAEVAGIAKDIILTRATDSTIHEKGQDGGFVSALLIHALDRGHIDGALVSYIDSDAPSSRAVPGVARTRDDVLAAAGSRYTYSANTMAYLGTVDQGLEKLAIVGMACMASVPGAMAARKAGKVARRVALSIGLLCSKTFDDAIFEELFEANYGLQRRDVVKMNIKGVVQIWMRDGSYHEIDLKQCHAWTRSGCMTCPDFAAEHADISAGGIGSFDGWTLTIIRTEQGRRLVDELLEAGLIEARPGDDDPGAIDLLRRLSIVSRRRWPQTVAVSSPRRGIPPPKPTPDAPAPG